MSKYDEQAVFEFLEKLRSSGITNMWGAGAYLESFFEMSKTEAKSWVIRWMESY